MKIKFFLPLLALLALSSTFISCNDDDNDGDFIPPIPTNALMLEDFVLDEMPTTISRASADEDFPEIKFLVYFKNNTQPQEDATYDVGVALYDANQKNVYTYTLYEDVNLTYEKSYKMDDKIQLSKDIKDGTYFLKPICKLDGEETWEDFKLADDLALNITVSGNQAQLKEAFYNATGTMKVNSMDIDKKKVSLNEPFKVTLNLSCNSTKSSIPVFIATADNEIGYKKLAGETWTANKNIVLSYAPSTPGKCTYYILSSLDDEPIAQFEVITKGQTYGFTVDNIADEIEYILDGDSLKGTLFANNYDDEVCSKDIYAMLIKIDMTDFSYGVDSLFEDSQKHQLVRFSTPSLGEEKHSFVFNNLNYDSYYSVTYGIKDENGRFKDISESDMFMIYTTAHNPSDSSEEEFPAMIKKKKAYMMKK